LNIVGTKWVGYDVDANGNKTPKPGSVKTAYTFGIKGMTTRDLAIILKLRKATDPKKTRMSILPDQELIWRFAMN